MALYDLNKDQVNFLRTIVTKVVPQGTREELKVFIATGDTVLNALNHPIIPAGKPNIHGPTPEEAKVIAECIS